LQILITGGAGFIGSHTADALLAAGHRVRVLDNLQQRVHPRGMPDYLDDDIEFIHGDVRDRDALQQALVDIDVVYHFAAYQDYLTDFSTFFQVNSVSTALLYELLVASGLAGRMHKVIVASSQAVMGEGRYRCPDCFNRSHDYLYPAIRRLDQLLAGQWDHCCPDCGLPLVWELSDETVSRPCNPYAMSKFSQEQIAIELGKRHGIPSVAMRYSIVQGPRQSFYNAYSGAMRIFALALHFGRRPVIYEDGCQARDFVHIADVVAANLLVLDDPAANYHVFNVGGGAPWTINDFYDAMQSLTHVHLPARRERSFRFGDTRHIVSDTRRLQKLGWQPRHDVRRAIVDYWQYLKSGAPARDLLDQAEKQMKTTQVVQSAGKA